MKTIKLTENDITRLVNKVLNETEMAQENYMFFSNLKQMKRQIEMIMEMDPNMVDEIIQNGHDWADDHISEAKTNMDQVFDFLKNEMEKESQYVDYEDINEGRKKQEHHYVLGENRLLSQNLKYIHRHMLTDTQFKFVKVISKV
jgi:vacuolar-type H+-ATPase subunit H